ncbi:Acyl-CoA synthetase (AMP-forming)/AMP-acid ligase II [Amycolatopsis pretoriensis]|uniref:Acyl-CoA synthetase (AMP-forming)/AMP-acid ligase II n=1 Tax=Amycolatopsis pretoriensis TaxID=218821 RepID=A0A1H5Q3S4_9PSEU|nr:fatty acyl-AMP ligase [Amycolatopsis pretoriensis]SEF20760.1 Acyl-CoA synthetase (AMP-forming)/AMP-acid ligase II [Amycolatopsis pretoriensis]
MPRPATVPEAVLRVSIVERLFARADDDRPLFTHQDHSHDAEHTVTWAEFAARVRVVAGELRRVAEPGERVAVLAGQELAYPLAFFGALAAGLIAVPLMPPGNRAQAERLGGVLADSGARVWLTSSAAAARVREFGDAGDLLVVDELSGPGADPVPVAPESPAYLQYTSGSTREPAGAVIPHRAIVAACWQGSRAYAVDEGTTCAGWIPFFHDMGLIQLLCLPVFAGGRAVFMAPAEFVHRPARWLRQLADYPAVFTAAPNFAYDLAAEAGAEAGLDLSDVRVALNGAEPVRPRTGERFLEVFGPHGFRREAYRPSYGLAEATVYVASAGPEGPSGAVFDRETLAQGRAVETVDGQELISVGRPIGQDVRIVHEGREQPEGLVGEIWIRGPNVATGYWRRGDAAAFDATLDGAGGWLRTGDLGVVHRGDLYVTGRLKDLIVVDGRNFHPQDIEAAAGEAHPAVRRDRVAAFGVADEHGEGAVVVAEWARDADADLKEVTRAVLRAVSREHDLTLRAVHLVPSGGLPRTSSGKVARSAAKARYGGARG